MKTACIICLFCCFALNSFSQAWVWEKPVNTTNNIITTDPNENIIILSAMGSITTQLSKYNKDGILVWSKLFTKATAFTASGSVVVDNNGNIYTFTDGFDSVNHQFTGIKLSGVTKFNPQGGIIWHVPFYSSTPLIQNKLAIQLDDNYNVYVGFSELRPSSSVPINLGNLTTTLTVNKYYLAIGSIGPDGTPRWVRGFLADVQPGGVGFFGATGFSVMGNKLFIGGYMGKYRLSLDNGLSLPVDRCSAWLAAFNTANGQSVWGVGHNLFVFCTGMVCFCTTPSINTNSYTGKIILTNTLNGGFVFKPTDTIASITSFGQPTVKTYYTIYDSLGNPVKGKTIQSVANYALENVVGSRGRFFFVTYLDTLRKVDTGYNLIWKRKMPGLTIQSVYVPKTGNTILFTYSKSGSNYFAKMVDSAGVISGRTYADWDDNGFFTSSDSAMSNILVTSDSAVTSSISGHDNGKYFMYAAPGTYSLHANFNHPYYQFLPATQSATISQYSDSVTGKDFRLRPLFSFTDVSVKFTALSIARPGRPAYYTITVKNSGAAPTNINVGLKLPALTAYSALTGGTVVVNAPDSITVSMNSVNPFQTKQAVLYLNIATAATNGDTLKFYPKAYPFTTDTIKTNNLDTLFQPVRTSFDPNEKEVNEKSKPLSDTNRALVYTVRFQNTGTDTAFYIRIADTLSSKLDPHSFNFIDASHPVTTEINNNIVNFIFNPIYLPDSIHNEPMSHGFVKYSIKPIAPVTISDTIYNHAAIYFDYNSPIITKSARSWYYQAVVSPPPTIVLLSFTGEKQGSNILLKFATASEPGLSYFVLERSTDSTVYSALGNINSNGTATTGSSYQFSDISPDPAINFYRLKIVYTDGRISYSGVVVIRTLISPQSNITEIRIFPNPVKNTLNFSLINVANPKIFNCTIADATGKIVWFGIINSTLSDTYTLNTAFLTNGIYFITLAHSNFAYRKLIVVIH